MIQIDIEMPKCCAQCPIAYIDDGGSWVCAIQNEELLESSVYAGRWQGECPLIEAEPVKPQYKNAGIFCGNCDSYIRTCDTFCSSCGTKIDWERK